MRMQRDMDDTIAQVNIMIIESATLATEQHTASVPSAVCDVPAGVLPQANPT